MSRFDRVVLATVVGLGLTVGVLSIASARLGPSVDTMSTAKSFDGTSVNTSINVTFTEPMNILSVEQQFRISPAVHGDYTWSGNTMVFIPSHPLAYQTTYAVSIRASARDTRGKTLYKPFRGTFRTQSEHLLYLGTAGDERGRLVLVSLGGKRQIIGSDDGLITGFAVSPDHSLVAYVKRGSASERADEIWLLSLTDNSTQQVLGRPDWSISQIHVAPDNSFIGFLAGNVLICQKYYGCARNRSGQVIYLTYLRTHKTVPFRSASEVPITYFLAISPAGQLGFTDLGSALTLASPRGTGVVHIPNRGNSPEFSAFDPTGAKAAFVGQTPESSGGDILVYQKGAYIDVSRGVYDSAVPAFSSSGKQIAYSAYRSELGVEPVYGINVYNFITRKTTKLTAERDWSDWSAQWSPDDRYITFIRSAPQEAMYMGNGEIWVMQADGRDARPLGGIGKDPTWIG